MSDMRYYPAMLDIAGRKCLVVGGGGVGSRKVKTLLECGAEVAVVTREAHPSLEELARQGKISLRLGEYRAQDMDGAFLVMGATDDEALNAQVSRDACQRNLLCNIADRPQACNFILPAIVRQGDLVVTVSTCGKSPAFAKHLRKKLEGQFGPEYALFLELMGAIREKLLAQAHAPEEHKPLFNRLIQGGLLDLLAKKDVEQADALLCEVLGPGYALEQLLKPCGAE